MPNNKQTLLDSLPTYIRSYGVGGRTAASDVREYFTEVINGVYEDMPEGGGFDPTANEVITAPFWGFDNNVTIGVQKSAGIYAVETETILGDWNGNGGGTILDINDDDGNIKVWANAFQIWRPNGYEDGDDAPRIVTAFGNDGSIWAGNGGMTVDQNGNLVAPTVTATRFGHPNGGDGTFMQVDDIACEISMWCYDYNEDYPIATFYGNGNVNVRNQISAGNLYTAGGSLSINNPDANDGMGAHTSYNVDNISSASVTPDGDSYGYSLSGFGISGTAPYDVGTGMGWGLNPDGVSGFNTQFPRNWSIGSGAASGSDEDSQTGYYIGGSYAGGLTDDGNNAWGINIYGIQLNKDGEAYFNVDSVGNITTNGVANLQSLNVNNGYLNVYTPSYPDGFLSVSDGVVTFGDLGPDNNATQMVLDDVEQYMSISGSVMVAYFNTADGSGYLANNNINWSSSGDVTLNNLKSSTIKTLNFANDTAAAAGGVPVGGIYNTAGTLKIRLS